MNPGQEPTPEGNDSIWPGVDGGHNWMSPSYNPGDEAPVLQRARRAAALLQDRCARIPARRSILRRRRRRRRALPARRELGQAHRHGRRRPARSAGSIASCRRPGRACSRRRATWCSRPRRAGTSTRSTRAPARSCGISTAAIACSPARLRFSAGASRSSRIPIGDVLIAFGLD